MKGGGAHGDFGDEAIQTILKRMEDERGLFFVFVAGYTDSMETFMKSNPGLSSRFDKILKFEDYTPEELQQIGISMLETNHYNLTESAKVLLFEKIKKIHLYRDKYFGNARTVRQIVQELMKTQNLRLSMVGKDNLAAVNANLIIDEDVNALQILGASDLFEKKVIGFK
jgi:hypothetical protein